MTFKIRKAREDQYHLILQWAKKEKWDIGIYDYYAYRMIDENGFFFGELDQKPIGFIGAVKYNQNMGFFGLFIVDLDHRGKGYGKKLFEFGLQQLFNRGVSNIGLESVTKQIAMYQKYKFKISHFTQRYFVLGTNQKYSSNKIKPLSDIPFYILVKYDQLCFFAKRQKFVSKWVNLPQSYSIGFVENEQLKGYAVLRKSIQGFKIGPLFADSVQIADQLLRKLCGRFQQNAGFTIEIPDWNKQGKILIQKYNMTLVSKNARMYTLQKPEIKQQKKIFGITSLAFG